jgi:hypothetical protein
VFKTNKAITIPYDSVVLKGRTVGGVVKDGPLDDDVNVHCYDAKRNQGNGKHQTVHFLSFPFDRNVEQSGG